MSRTEFGARVRQQAWDRCQGRCEAQGCGIKLQVGRFHYDHDMPDGLGGKPTLDNCKVLCIAHHKEKTAEIDNPLMTKADNMRKAHLGITVAKRPMPGSRASGFKKKMDGSVERR